MTTKDAIELMEYAVLFSKLSDAGAYRIALQVSKLARLGAEAKTHAERLCNYGESKEGQDQAKRSSIRTRAMIALTEIGGAAPNCEIEVHGDPRGACLQIHFKRPLGVTCTMRF